jgi:CRISPR/Cas system CSM-associated protein Csm3 (group 7 of RAMP superfamily)
MTIVHRLVATLEFPAGIAPGEGRGSNRLMLARDGTGRYVLRGSALAGALRHAYARACGCRSDHASVNAWFGKALGDSDTDGGVSSPLRVPDTVLELGLGVSMGRTHNAVNRHTGAVIDGSLVTIETLPPGTKARCALLVEVPPSNDASAREFLAFLIGLLTDGLTLGGHAARGIGLVRPEGPVLYRRFDLSMLEEHARWLDELYAWRGGKLPTEGEPLTASPTATGKTLCLKLRLGVPRGQDILIGGGAPLDTTPGEGGTGGADEDQHDFAILPQWVRGSDGTASWRLPGSSIRGVFRAWYARLAAREGEAVFDQLDTLRSTGREPASLTGKDLAWGLYNEESGSRIQRDLDLDPASLDKLISCPVLRLFGTSFAKGRIHVADAYAQLSEPQARTHVAVDRITGGTNEGFLFSNQVLTGPIEFTITITVSEPTADEARRLAMTIRALDLGLLRVGSSKASGRLALRSPVEASGPGSEKFRDLTPSEE